MTEAEIRALVRDELLRLLSEPPPELRVLLAPPMDVAAVTAQVQAMIQRSLSQTRR